MAVIRDVVDSLRRAGFRRVLIVNGHGGNNPVGALAQELMAQHPEMSIKFHNWWNAPETWAKIQSIDSSGSHANWMENFPWTRLAHAPAPEGEKSGIDMALMKACAPGQVREMLGDGSFGGPWQRPDSEMLAIWETGVAETRAALEGPWAGGGDD
jgi:creatinine amidohydrolase